ncbi:uncharacterized protein LOC126818754 [Patella vulgata]|uniref:uncharacterized protein LOC126818754 n=1 Tax=Patella vulgata TaxID=6465 RepID=UPI00217F660E|nr:uncharacterized protein LOC126818754 [Patella vulgata]
MPRKGKNISSNKKIKMINSSLTDILEKDITSGNKNNKPTDAKNTNNDQDLTQNIQQSGLNSVQQLTNKNVPILRIGNKSISNIQSIFKVKKVATTNPEILSGNAEKDNRIASSQSTFGSIETKSCKDGPQPSNDGCEINNVSEHTIEVTPQHTEDVHAKDIHPTNTINQNLKPAIAPLEDSINYEKILTTGVSKTIMSLSDPAQKGLETKTLQMPDGTSLQVNLKDASKDLQKQTSELSNSIQKDIQTEDDQSTNTSLPNYMNQKILMPDVLNTINSVAKPGQAAAEQLTLKRQDGTQIQVDVRGTSECQTTEGETQNRKCTAGQSTKSGVEKRQNKRKHSEDDNRTNQVDEQSSEIGCVSNQVPSNGNNQDVEEISKEDGNSQNKVSTIKQKQQSTVKDVTKYQKILTPDVLKTIMSLNNPVQQGTEAHMLQLPDGTLIKIDFQTVKKRMLKKGPKRKRKKQGYPKGFVCLFEPPVGERISMYQDRSELDAFIVKCTNCTGYHCPLCPWTRYQAARSIPKLNNHIDIVHWNKSVPVIIDDAEYRTLNCNLHHGTVKSKHLHCPCGAIFKTNSTRERFLRHRRFRCPLTEHIRKQRGTQELRKEMKRFEACRKPTYPREIHKSIFDSWEDFQESVTFCESCKRYHCLVCPTTHFRQSSHGRLLIHLRMHFRSRVILLNGLDGEEGPFFLGCLIHHGEFQKRHFHCLCNRIFKSNKKLFKKHLEICPYIKKGEYTKDDYTRLKLYNDAPTDTEAFLTVGQVKGMISRNSMPAYSRLGEKIPPPALLASIFSSIQELCSVSKRCYICCTRYHCPLCPNNNYRPSDRTQLAKHLLQYHHKYKLLLPSGLFSYPCNLPHNTDSQVRHYHCVCGYSPMVRKRFLKHSKVCAQARQIIPCPVIAEQYQYNIPDASLIDLAGFQGSGSMRDIDFNQPLQEIFQGSSSEDETAIDEPLFQVKHVETNLKLDHAYGQTKKFFEESLQDHLKAKAAYEAQNSLADNEGDEECHQFDVPVETENKHDHRVAINHEITNMALSDPMYGIFNPFDMLVAQVKKCETCCKFYHCPYCPPMYFKPVARRLTIKHLKTHWSKRVIMIDGTFALPCFQNHGVQLTKHYHCMCGSIVEASATFFYNHVHSCLYMEGLVEECQKGRQEVNAPLKETYSSDPSQKGLDKVVTELTNHLQSPIKLDHMEEVVDISPRKHHRKRNVIHGRAARTEMFNPHSCTASQPKKQKLNEQELMVEAVNNIDSDFQILDSKDSKTNTSNVINMEDYEANVRQWTLSSMFTSIANTVTCSTIVDTTATEQTVYASGEQDTLSEFNDNDANCNQDGDHHNQCSVVEEVISMCENGQQNQSSRLAYEGCNYEIVLPSTGNIDINQIQGLLSEGNYNYVVVNNTDLID